MFIRSLCWGYSCWFAGAATACLNPRPEAATVLIVLAGVSAFVMLALDTRAHLRGLPTLFVVLVLCSTAHAGGYCYNNSCYHQTYVQREYVPQTIIEHQNVEQFFQVPNYVQQYAVTPSAVASAKLGELERADAQMRDRIVEYKQQLAQQQPVQAQQVCQPVCMVPQGYMLVPTNGQQPAATPAQPQQSAPATPPQVFSERASIIQQACAKCHTGANAKGDLDFERPVTCEQKQKAITKAAIGEMPKNGPKLSPEQFVQLTKEIGALNTSGSAGGDSRDN